LKGIYDLHLPLKLIVSGSSSLEIRSKVQEALTGRKKVFHLGPFDLEELSSAKSLLLGHSDVSGDKKYFNELFSEFLTYGGYPAVALARDREIKIQILSEIFRSYIEKDVKSFLHIENEYAFRNLVKILASQTGNLVNKHELSSSLGIHKNTLDNYLFYLEQTFLIDFIRPFFKNSRTELLKNPKAYFNDPGMRNFALGAFGEFDFRPDRGCLFENFCYLCLKSKIEDFATIHFWRTKAGAEVDFVVSGKEVVPVEAKASSMREPKISRSLRSFIYSYRPARAFYLNMCIRENLVLDNTRISFITPSDLMAMQRI
jgi:predicted AAA+ superfamily ATPase